MDPRTVHHRIRIRRVTRGNSSQDGSHELTSLRPARTLLAQIREAVPVGELIYKRPRGLRLPVNAHPFYRSRGCIEKWWRASRPVTQPTQIPRRQTTLSAPLLHRVLPPPQRPDLSPS
jgi:hypothetical protein